MEIIINRNVQQQTTLVKSILKPFFFKQYAIALGIAAIALILMFIKIDIYGKKLPFWNISSAIALGLLMIAILRLRGLLKQYQLAMVTASENIQITINEEAITYATETYEAKFQWSYFKFYRLQDLTIIIEKDTSRKSAIPIDKNELNEQEIQFLQNLFFSKKISKR